MKPSFFQDVDLLELSMAHRLLFVGLWCWADRDGRLKDSPKQIKFDILPMDDVDVPKILEDLAAGDFIIRYEVKGCKYIQITNFHKHQNPHSKEAASEIPPQPGNYEASTGLAEERQVLSGLIPDSLNLIPDSGFPQPASAEVMVSIPDDQLSTSVVEICRIQSKPKGSKKPTGKERAELHDWLLTRSESGAEIEGAMRLFCEDEYWLERRLPLRAFRDQFEKYLDRYRELPPSVVEYAEMVPAVVLQPRVDYLATWNNLVPAAPTALDVGTDKLADLWKAENNSEFQINFERICETAQKILTHKPESTWLDFYWVIGTKKGSAIPNWKRLLTNMRGMAAKSSSGPEPTEGQLVTRAAVKAMEERKKALGDEDVIKSPWLKEQLAIANKKLRIAE